MEQALKRRNFLRNSIGLAGALVVGKAAAAPSCTKTVTQTAGPFYPGEQNISPVNDLTQVNGRSALGPVIYVRGVVRDLNCLPVAGANVEIWQACASGRYNHDHDPNTAALDPNFRYWGEAFTNGNGEYEFKTVLPGAYPADTDWERPPHIHFRVAKRGYVELITQMYFEGDPLNDVDKILERIPERLRKDVIVPFEVNPQDPTTRVGHFAISIEKV